MIKLEFKKGECKMKVEEIYMTVSDFFLSFLDKKGEIIGISRKNDQWRVLIEIPEDVEYTNEYAKKDLKAVYEVIIDNNMEISSYNKIKVIERGVPMEVESEY